MTIEMYHAGMEKDSRPIFSDVSFLADPGERVALFGTPPVAPSLALQALLGVRKLDSGWACIDGEPLIPPQAAYFRRYISYLPQSIGFGNMTVEDVACLLYGEKANSGNAYSRENLTNQLDSVGVSGECACKPFAALDAATAQRAAIAVTFMLNRPVALLDNPTSMQDDRGRALVAEYLASRHFADTAMVVATADPAVLEICGKAVRFGVDDGQQNIKNKNFLDR